MRQRDAVHAAIIAVGTELVLDGRSDTNGVTVARLLASRGIDARMRLIVPDDEEEIALALEDVQRRFQIIIVTGGLGPTIDDVTREAACKAFDLDLQEDRGVLDSLKERCRALGREMSSQSARQAMVPHGATVLPNASGTAPGLQLTVAGTSIFLLPGVPHEMELMMRDHVLNRLDVLGLRAGSPRSVSRALKVSGMTEVEVQERILDLLGQPGEARAIDLTLLASPAEITVILRGAREDLIAHAFERVRERLGRAVFAEDLDTGIEAAVGRALEKRGLSLAAAESCTGGLLAEMITRVPGSSSWFTQAWVTYCNEAKISLLGIEPALIVRHGAVSAEVAEAMAEAARRISGASIAVSISGIAGPSGASPGKPIGLAYLGVADRVGTRVTRHLFAGDREAIRLFSARTTLNRVRLECLEAGE
jgi:nicotinamide-nucleotide amidase